MIDDVELRIRSFDIATIPVHEFTSDTVIVPQNNRLIVNNFVEMWQVSAKGPLNWVLFVADKDEDLD